MKEPEQATVPLRCRGRMGPALVKITCVQPPRIRLQEEHEGKEVVVHLLSGGLRSDLAHTEALSQATKAKQSSVVRTELLTYYEPIDSVGVLFNERFEALMVLAPFVKQSIQLGTREARLLTPICLHRITRLAEVQISIKYLLSATCAPPPTAEKSARLIGWAAESDALVGPFSRAFCCAAPILLVNHLGQATNGQPWFGGPGPISALKRVAGLKFSGQLQRLVGQESTKYFSDISCILVQGDHGSGTSAVV